MYGKARIQTAMLSEALTVFDFSEIREDIVTHLKKFFHCSLRRRIIQKRLLDAVGNR